MTFSTDILVSSTFSNQTYSYLQGSESINYYIHDFENNNFEVASGEAYTLEHSEENETFIRSIFDNLDPIISLDFNEVFNPNEAILRIYSVSDFNFWDQSTVGQVSNQLNYWDILWRNSFDDTSYDQNTIIHEIGHSLGLSHPNEDPTNPIWDTDITVMSYNKSSNGWNTAFSVNDIDALKLIWGTEEEGLQFSNEVNNDPLPEINDLPSVDDFGQDSNTLGEIDVGGSLNGVIERLGDRDWFAFNLSAGQILQLQLSGYSSNLKTCPCFFCNKINKENFDKNKEKNNEIHNLDYDNSLSDPFLRLYDSDSNLLDFDDDSGLDNNSLVQYTADYSGTYYASAGAYEDNLRGNYTLSLTLDDFSSDIFTKGTISYSETIYGNLEVVGDKDWFSINTVENDELKISLIGNSLKDSYLNIYNSSGTIVHSNDDYSDLSLDSEIKFSAAYTGNYYISVEAFKNSYKGTYTLISELLSSPSNENNQETHLDSDLDILNYVASNSDLIKAFGTNLEEAREHYINYGISEGRNINGFNATNYLNKYGDLSNIFGNDLEAAIRHYINYGYAEGRTDSVLDLDHNDNINTDSNEEITTLTELETLSYIASNSDLIRAFGTNLEKAREHYINHGILEGRNINGFNPLNYLDNYGDLSNIFGNDIEAATRHFINYGYAEGRTDLELDISNNDDIISDSNEDTTTLTELETLSYIASNSDLIRAFGTNLDKAREHYINHGFSEGRNINGFNATNYLYNYGDLSNIFGNDTEAATRHYINYGYAEGRTDSELDISNNEEITISTDLETLSYIASNSDLIRAFGTNLEEARDHYINYGISEGRNINGFNATNYLNNYRDLSNIFGNDLEEATRHYINFGYFEGRIYNIIL